jgi:hypothetical protein
MTKVNISNIFVTNSCLLTRGALFFAAAVEEKVQARLHHYLQFAMEQKDFEVELELINTFRLLNWI